MDLNRAAIFVRVVEEGGFTAAARVLRLPKSSVSRAVSLLEEELGARLLQRSTRKIRLTEAGTTFYQRASRGIAGVEEAAAAVGDLQGSLRGPIRITAPVDAGVWLLAPLVSPLRRDAPGGAPGRGADRAGGRPGRRGVRLRAAGRGPFATRRWSPASWAGSRPRSTRPRLPRAARDAGPGGGAGQHDCILFRANRGRATWNLTAPPATSGSRSAGRWGSTTSPSCGGSCSRGPASASSPPSSAGARWTTGAWSACCPGTRSGPAPSICSTAPPGTFLTARRSSATSDRRADRGPVRAG